MKPCPVCKRQYAHLSTCPVLAMHTELDKKLADFGADHVRIQLVLGAETTRTLPTVDEMLRG